MIRAIPSILLTFLLVACGGSGGSSDSGNNGGSTESGSEEVKTGTFLDSAVAGLSYSTETLSGVTDDAGNFNYISGETITFTLADVIFPSTVADELLTPLSLASTSDVEEAVVVRMLRFLQSIDSDNNPSNGITIAESLRTIDTGLDFSVTDSEFETQLISAIATLRPDRPAPVSAQDALDHFKETIAAHELNGAFTANTDNAGEGLSLFYDDPFKAGELLQGSYEITAPGSSDATVGFYDFRFMFMRTGGALISTSIRYGEDGLPISVSAQIDDISWQVNLSGVLRVLYADGSVIEITAIDHSIYDIIIVAKNSGGGTERSVLGNLNRVHCPSRNLPASMLASLTEGIDSCTGSEVFEGKLSEYVFVNGFRDILRKNYRADGLLSSEMHDINYFENMDARDIASQDGITIPPSASFTAPFENPDESITTNYYYFHLDTLPGLIASYENDTIPLSDYISEEEFYASGLDAQFTYAEFLSLSLSSFLTLDEYISEIDPDGQKSQVITHAFKGGATITTTYDVNGNIIHN